MLRMFLRFVSPVQQRPVELRTDPGRFRQANPNSRQVPQCHRDRLLSMRIEHTRMCSDQRCQMLREIGVFTAGDLLTCDLQRLHKQARRQSR